MTDGGEVQKEENEFLLKKAVFFGQLEE